MAGLDVVEAVSPELEVEGNDSDMEEVFKGGVEGERIGAHGDERVVRRLVDPRRPSVQEVGGSFPNACSLSQLVSTLRQGKWEGFGSPEMCDGRAGVE